MGACAALDAKSFVGEGPGRPKSGPYSDQCIHTFMLLVCAAHGLGDCTRPRRDEQMGSTGRWTATHGLGD